MKQLKSTVLTISVHPEGDNPVFANSATRVTLDDEGSGIFIVLDQSGADFAQNGQVRLDVDEIAAINKAIETLLRQHATQAACNPSMQPIYKGPYAELVKAAYAMVRAHMDNETMVPALDDVAKQFPNLTREQLRCLWMGVNAKDREGLIGAQRGLKRI